ncbi:hypothetical protein G9A89_016161 [Geosiphon pyriformis]|nr:hypothetical protein G9A89_016161 [Geosiphon pyriformis]
MKQKLTQFNAKFERGYSEQTTTVKKPQSRIKLDLQIAIEITTTTLIPKRDLENFAGAQY